MKPGVKGGWLDWALISFLGVFCWLVIFAVIALWP